VTFTADPSGSAGEQQLTVAVSQLSVGEAGPQSVLLAEIPPQTAISALTQTNVLPAHDIPTQDGPSEDVRMSDGEMAEAAVAGQGAGDDDGAGRLDPSDGDGTTGKQPDFVLGRMWTASSDYRESITAPRKGREIILDSNSRSSSPPAPRPSKRRLADATPPRTPPQEDTPAAPVSRPPTPPPPTPLPENSRTTPLPDDNPMAPISRPTTPPPQDDSPAADSSPFSTPPSTPPPRPPPNRKVTRSGGQQPPPGTSKEKTSTKGQAAAKGKDTGKGKAPTKGTGPGSGKAAAKGKRQKGRKAKKSTTVVSESEDEDVEDSDASDAPSQLLKLAVGKKTEVVPLLKGDVSPPLLVMEVFAHIFFSFLVHQPSLTVPLRQSPPKASRLSCTMGTHDIQE
jgi:hypothetical protein